jgi:Xaa-Pro aminopeptidase
MSDPNLKLEKTLELINKKGLDGLIIYSGGTCSILGPSYLTYFCEARPLGPRNCAVVTKDGRVSLLVEPVWDAPRMAAKAWITDVRGTSRFTDDLLEIVKGYGVNGTMGLVGGREMSEEVYAAISGKVKLEPTDAIVETLAREKSARELEIIYRASRIADLGFEAFVGCARPGMREYDLTAEMEYVMRAEGADDIFILISSGSHNYEMHEPTDRRLKKGDIIIGEITPVCEGQFVQLCRTMTLGEPAPVVYEKYRMLLHAFAESLAQIRPGVEASGMSKAMNQVISDAGYAKYCYPPYMRARGHGFGIGSIAPGGVIDDNTKAAFERLQAVVVHPNQYIPETGYLACGETVLVGINGIQRLAATETKLYVKEV